MDTVTPKPIGVILQLDWLSREIWRAQQRSSELRRSIIPAQAILRIVLRAADAVSGTVISGFPLFSFFMNISCVRCATMGTSETVCLRRKPKVLTMTGKSYFL